MTPRSAATIAVALLILCVGRTADAGDSPVPEHGELTVNLGAGRATDHLTHPNGLTAPPPLYLGFELHVRIRQPFGVGVVAAANSVTGWLFGANFRAEAHTSPHVFLSAGAGPLIAASDGLAGLLLVEADATASVRFTTNAALTVGPILAIALNNEGTRQCGVDTCNAWAGPGDHLLLLRVGFGAAF